MPELMIDAIPTWYETTGGGPEDLVLLHGGLSSSEALSGVFAPFSASYRVTSFDRRGHGRTPDSPEEFHYDSMASETIALLEHLGTRAHLVGSSDGGIVAAMTAFRRPEMVDRLVADWGQLPLRRSQALGDSAWRPDMGVHRITVCGSLPGRTRAFRGRRREELRDVRPRADDDEGRHLDDHGTDASNGRRR